jgi:hypothetical protein
MEMILETIINIDKYPEMKLFANRWIMDNDCSLIDFENQEIHSQNKYEVVISFSTSIKKYKKKNTITFYYVNFI